MSKELKATYEMIIGYKNRPTNHWLAIGEFIDNSISSYQNKDTSNPVEGLVIDIEVDSSDLNNKKVIVTDNAKGMTAAGMEDATQPNDRKNKSDSDINQYGVGMKLGAFWLGQDLTFYSKVKDCKEHKLSIITTTADLNTSVSVEAIESYEHKIRTESGTKIIVSNVYDNRDLLSHATKVSKFERALGWRYSYLLLKGLVINLSFKNADGTKNSKKQIAPFVRRYMKVSEMYAIELNRSGDKKYVKLQGEKQKVLNKSVETLLSNMKSDSELFNNNLLQEAIIKIQKDEELKFSKLIKVNNEFIELEFGIASEKYNEAKLGEMSGVCVKHADRAIMHGPNDDNTSCFQFKYKQKGSGGDATLRRLIGEMSLTGIEVPDENKSRFNWSRTGEQDIEAALISIYKDLDNILDIIVKVSKMKENIIPSLQESKKMVSCLTSSVNPEHITDIKVIDNPGKDLSGYTMKHKMNDQIYTINIFEDWNPQDYYFMDAKKDDFAKKITIKIEAENSFWKPLIEKADFKSKILFPLAIILSVGDFIYNNDPAFDNFIDPNKSKTFIEIVGCLVKEYNSGE
ncbi:MAG: ATP-binding protein [Mycoplasma sp.]